MSHIGPILERLNILLPEAIRTAMVSIGEQAIASATGVEGDPLPFARTLYDVDVVDRVPGLFEWCARELALEVSRVTKHALRLPYQAPLRLHVMSGKGAALPRQGGLSLAQLSALIFCTSHPEGTGGYWSIQPPSNPTGWPAGAVRFYPNPGGIIVYSSDILPCEVSVLKNNSTQVTCVIELLKRDS